MTRAEFLRRARLTGLLLTPVMVWAASFLGGWLGATIGKSTGYLLAGGISVGTAGLVGWILLIRRVGKTIRAPKEDKKQVASG